MISLIILGIIFLYAIISYNTLTRKRNNVDNAFGSIDVMLKKRFDLIPNLVATVQQYAKHEAIPLPCLNPLEHSTLATHENAVITSQAINSKRKL